MSTPISIDDLLDVGINQQKDAKTVIQQNAITFKATTRPNPPLQINIQSEAQLETALTDLVVPTGTNVTISVDASFTLDKPIKVGLGSGLEIFAPTLGTTITYTGSIQCRLRSPTKPATAHRVAKPAASRFPASARPDSVLATDASP